MKKRNQHGFTLMELMVVIVIVAILAAVAVPLYINYVNDAKRTEAKGAIAAIISAEQVNFQRFGSYTADSTALNLTSIIDEVDRNWDFTITVLDPAEQFQIHANGKEEAAGLDVTCTYDREPTAGQPAAVWTDTAP